MLVFVANILSAQNTSPSEQKVLQTSQTIWDATLKGDLATFSKWVDDQAYFVHMGATFSKKQEIEAIETKMITPKALDIEQQSVRITGQNAVVFSKLKLIAVVGGNEVTNPFVVTEVFVEKNGEWKLFSLAYTRIVY